MLKLYITVIYCNMPHKSSSCTTCSIRRCTTMQCVWTCSITTLPHVKVRHPVLNLLEADNRALASIGFIMQRAPRRPLSTTTMTSFHCPPVLFPTTTLYYTTSLNHRHLIRWAITAGGCVERCANCSPSRHAPRDSLYRCRRRHLAQHVGDSIPD